MQSKPLSDKQAGFIELAVSVFNKEALRKIVFSRPVSSEISKVTGRLCAHRAKRVLALEYSLPGNTVSHKNLSSSDIQAALEELISEYSQANLISTLGDAEWKISSKGKEALLGADKLKRRILDEPMPFESAIAELDKRKNYILRGDESFLIKLGISDKNGRVHDKKQGKYRQINRFLEHIEAVYPNLSDDGELTVYDLCCGKSYLSFAAYYYLTAIKGRRVRLLGIDLKRDVISWCDSLAKEMGFDGMQFIYDDVRNTPRDLSPDMVISLHACDIATDIVIDTAISIGAKVILSTPCCHRYLNSRISTPELSFVRRYAHLSNKLCEALTDSIRAARLCAGGYDVTVPELTDPDDTPKNTLIRAIKKPMSDKKLKEYKDEYEKILDYVLCEGKSEYLTGL